MLSIRSFVRAIGPASLPDYSGGCEVQSNKLGLISSCRRHRGYDWYISVEVPPIIIEECEVLEYKHMSGSNVRNSQATTTAKAIITTTNGSPAVPPACSIHLAPLKADLGPGMAPTHSLLVLKS